MYSEASVGLTACGADGGVADSVGAGAAVTAGSSGAAVGVGSAEGREGLDVGRRGGALRGTSMCSAKARRSEAELGSITPPHNRLRYAQDIDVPDSRRLC